MQRRQRAADPQRRVGPAVHHLQQLDGELDVAQAAAAELELALGLRRRDVLLDPAAHRLHLADEARPVAGLPHQRPERVDVGAAEVGVAGDRAHLQQRLELPGAGPLLVVGRRARRAVRTSAPALPSGRSAASTSQAASRQIRISAAATRVALAERGALGVARVDRLGHEDDVDVADVVELPAAALAQRDDGQPAGGGVGGLLGDGERRARR